MTPAARRPRTAIRPLAAGAAGVIAWSVLALFYPSDWIPIPQHLRIPNLVMGLVFLVCGMTVRRRRADGPGRAFYRYCLGAALHWGGLPSTPGPSLASALFLAYVGASACGEGALLELVSRVRREAAPTRPRRGPLAARGETRVRLRAGICGRWQGAADERDAGHRAGGPTPPAAANPRALWVGAAWARLRCCARSTMAPHRHRSRA
jgi:hypothetical protein